MHFGANMREHTIQMYGFRNVILYTYLWNIILNQKNKKKRKDGKQNMRDEIYGLVNDVDMLSNAKY